MLLELVKVIFIGIIEGITEWLPISSTGHMILFESLVTLKMVSPEFWEFFLVAIQLGAVLAVCVLYFHRLNPFAKAKDEREKRATWRLWGLVVIGCVPAGIVGLLLDDWLNDVFYHFVVVAIALLGYGIVFVLLERFRKGRGTRVDSVEDLTPRDALLIGCFQVLSLIPGTSRSGSTILGASLIGVGRTAAAEFSFFMALPVMVAASLLKGYKFVSAGVGISGPEITFLAVGLIVSFLVSLVVIRFLMDFVRRHSFAAFGWYRIALGAAVLGYYLIMRI